MPTLHMEGRHMLCEIQSAKSKVRMYEMKKRHGYLACGARALKRMRVRAHKRMRTLENEGVRLLKYVLWIRSACV